MLLVEVLGDVKKKNRSNYIESFSQEEKKG
jgi:hypothetical protein